MWNSLDSGDGFGKLGAGGFQSGKSAEISLKGTMTDKGRGVGVSKPEGSLSPY